MFGDGGIRKFMRVKQGDLSVAETVGTLPGGTEAPGGQESERP